MKNKSPFAVTFILLLLISAPAWAADYCVRAGATGDGSNWNNAYGQLPAVLVRGGTYYVADGTFAAGYTFSTPVSGTTYITVKKATIADHGPATGWNNSFGDGVALWNGMIEFNTSYIIFDGQTGGGPGSWKTGHGFEVYRGGIGDPGNGALMELPPNVGFIEVRHVHIHATYDSYYDAFHSTGGGVHDITVSHCYAHDLFGVFFGINGWTNTLVEKSYFARNKCTAEWHTEWISYIGTVANMTVRHNLFYQIEGTAHIAGVNNGSARNWKIYGNVLANSGAPPVAVYHDGSNNNSMNNMQFYNNIISRIGNFQGAILIQEGTGNQVYNNIWFTCRCNTIGISNAIHDYNWYADNYRIEDCDPPCDLDQDAVSAETHAQHGAGNPFVNWDGVSDPADADFRLNAATNAGLALAAEFNTDMSGVLRGSDGVWDRGACEYVPTGPSLAVTAPSVNTIWRLGTSHNITWAYNELTGNVTIDWYKSGTSQTIAQNVSIGNRSYTWAIPDDFETGNDYFIKISSGTTEADSGVFSILARVAPQAQTNAANSITYSSAVLNGTVNAHGLATIYYFEYGTTDTYSSSTTVTSGGSGENNVSVSAAVDGLTASTTYHFRLVATNSEGTTYGNDLIFTTSGGGGGGGGSGDSGGSGGGGGCFIAAVGQSSILWLRLLSLLGIGLVGWRWGNPKCLRLGEK